MFFFFYFRVEIWMKVETSNELGKFIRKGFHPKEINKTFERVCVVTFKKVICRVRNRDPIHCRFGFYIFILSIYTLDLYQVNILWKM